MGGGERLKKLYLSLLQVVGGTVQALTLCPLMLKIERKNCKILVNASVNVYNQESSFLASCRFFYQTGRKSGHETQATKLTSTVLRGGKQKPETKFISQATKLEN